MYNIQDGANVFRKYFYLEPLPVALENTLKIINSEPNCIWVFDGVDSRKKRRDIFPEYKTNRNKDGYSADDLAMFEEMKRYKKEVIPSWGGIVLEFPEWEADDIIYNLVKFLKVSSVRSTDIDFWQMLKANPELQLPETNKPKCNWEDIILYKTLVGDKSDNISGLKGFGDAAWNKLDLNDKDNLNSSLFEKTKEPPIVSNPKLQGSLELSWDQLKIFYQVVSFIEIDEVEFEKMIKG